MAKKFETNLLGRRAAGCDPDFAGGFIVGEIIGTELDDSDDQDDLAVYIADERTGDVSYYNRGDFRVLSDDIERQLVRGEINLADLFGMLMPAAEVTS